MTATEHSVASAERLFLEQLPVVDRILEIITRRNALSGSDADEFSAWARGRLTDDDYGILRKFGGRSSLQTYLSVVLSNLFRDYRNSAWGRWRPSAAATRLGPIGIRLEELLSRDGCSLREAVGIIRSRGAQCSDGELTRMAARLPLRPVEREVALDKVDRTLTDESTTPVAQDEDMQAIADALRSAIDELPDEDRIITRMRFWDALSIADIARTLHLDQKPLYRRLESIQVRLRTSLARHGISEGRAREALTSEGLW